MRFGVDEAGKGPVLGSMFVAAVGVPTTDDLATDDPATDDPAIGDLTTGVTATGDADPLPDGLEDSKQLTPERREALDATLRNDPSVEIAVVDVPPDRIDDPETDMNTLTVEAHADAVSDLCTDGDHGIVDAGDTSEVRFARRLTEYATVDVDVTAEHGADDTYDVVAAASIVAKVARDNQMTALADAHGAVGSGYPSDPTTRAFLADYVDTHGDLPDFARRSWSTCDDVLAAAEQAGLDHF